MRTTENRRRERKEPLSKTKSHPCKIASAQAESMEEERWDKTPIPNSGSKIHDRQSTRGTSDVSPLISTGKPLLFTEMQFNCILEKLSSPPKPFPQHISEKHRAAILDWTIEVLSLYGQSPLTFFRCSRLIDAYYSLNPAPSSLDIHITGAAALSLASKFDNTRFITLGLLAGPISKDKFTVEELKAREVEVALAGGWDLARPTIPELVHEGMCLRGEGGLGEGEARFLRNTGVMLARMCVFARGFVEDCTEAELAGLCLVLGVKLMEQLRPEAKSKEMMEVLIRRFRLGGPLLFQKLQALHQFTLDFEQRVPNARNLVKYHTFSG